MRAIAAFAMLAALSACASAPRAAEPGPLKAELTEDEFGARVHLTAPAYVAVFAITPGSGTYLAYPRDEADRPMLGAGTHVVIPRSTTRGARALSGNTSTYLYLIASKEPLEVEQFQTGDRSVREVIGTENATSQDLTVVMQSLDVAVMSTDATVAGPWTSDVLTPWERVASRGSRGQGNVRSMGFNERCQGTWVTGNCRAIQPTPAERRATRRGGGGAAGGGGTNGGRGGGSKPGGGQTGNN